MNKFVMAIVCASLLAGSAFAAKFPKDPATAPAFTEGSAVVIDLASMKSTPKDNVRLVSDTKKENISFKVYYFDAKKNSWVLDGPAELKGHGDTCFVDSNVKASKHRYWAVVSESGSFNYENACEHHDLYIYVKD